MATENKKTISANNMDSLNNQVSKWKSKNRNYIKILREVTTHQVISIYDFEQQYKAEETLITTVLTFTEI